MERKPGAGNPPFRSDEAFAENRAQQLSMTPQTMTQLRRFGVTDGSRLKLEYFFYTNSEEKAEALAQSLSAMGYDCEYGVSADDDSLVVITGWTSPMAMDDSSVTDWTARMCDLGREHDCEFDGWGTNPEQSTPESCRSPQPRRDASSPDAASRGSPCSPGRA